MMVQPLRSCDFNATQAIFNSVFPVKYSLEFTEAWNNRCAELSYGAFSSDGLLLGFLLTTKPQANTVQVEFLGVNPRKQKGGIGSFLLQKILNYCIQTKTRATLIPVNDPRIIQWYKKYGFAEYGSPKISRYTGDIEQTYAYICA